MDDEQRERMHDLKRSTWRGVLTGCAFLVFAILAAMFLLDDWTVLLFSGTTSLALTIVVFISHWHAVWRCDRADSGRAMRTRSGSRAGWTGIVRICTAPIPARNRLIDDEPKASAV